MADFKKVRLFKVSKELNVSVDTLEQHLQQHGYASALSGTGINASITDEEAYLELLEEFAADKAAASRIKEMRAARREEMEAEAAAAAAAEASAAAAAEAPAKAEPVQEAPAAPAPAEAPQEEAAPATEAAPDAVPAEMAAEQPLPEAAPAEVEALPAEAAPAEAAPAEAPPAEAAAPQEAAAPEEAAPAEAPVAAASEAPAAEEEPQEASVAAAEAPPEGAEAVPVARTRVEGGGEAEQGEAGEALLTASRYQLAGTKVVGKIDLGSVEERDGRKRKRKRKRKGDEAPAPTPAATPTAPATTASESRKRKKKRTPEVNEAEVEHTLQETLRELEMGAKRVRQRRRRARRDERAAERERVAEMDREQEKVLRVTEFVSTGELANLMNVPVTEVISTLFTSGMIVSINQRLDADTIQIVADEFGYEVKFITDVTAEDIVVEEDAPEDLEGRPPVVTVMGHVDHGKTSLLDYIRSANVVAGEAGGITQHIGAYHVEVEGGNVITFLDTPGHEAFTAMRARGAQATDVVILVVAADDAVMPQTVEAINHAKAAEVPIVVAINKIDKPEANPARVMQQLADHGVLVEEYGGNVQSAQVSAKTGLGVDELLEKVILQAEVLELTANPNRRASGLVIESRMQKGRGNVATVLVQNGTLRVGDSFVAGIHSGRVRAMFDERENRIDAVGPSRPALVLGFDGSPEVGDQFVVLEDEREAREIAQRRQQIHREQALRQRKHITLDEIGRRLALGDFQELNLIIKADVGGSVEALSDSLLKLSTDEVQVNIVHSGVGAITESDVMLASASDAVIIGFQVRPAPGARTVAEREEIDIRTYSVIYDAIEDVRDALEGLLSPEKSERTTSTVEVRDIFKVPKVGTVAGCYVVEGRIHRNDPIRLIRDGVVIYSGRLASLKRFKDDVREVASGYECGLSIDGYNDIKVGDYLEGYEVIETKRRLEV